MRGVRMRVDWVREERVDKKEELGERGVKSISFSLDLYTRCFGIFSSALAAIGWKCFSFYLPLPPLPSQTFPLSLILAPLNALPPPPADTHIH